MNAVINASYLKWGHRKNRQLLTLSMLLAMIISLGLQSFSIFTTVQRPLDTSGENSTLVSEGTPPLKQEDFSLLFGFNNRQDIKEQVTDIPITKLSLILRGAMAGLEYKKYASAIIQSSSQDKLYEIGDSLPGGATLKQVFSDHVVIKRGTQLEKLYFPEAAKDSRAFQEYQQPSAKKPEAQSRSGQSNPQNDKPLEERMQELREKLHQANQGN